MADDSSFVLDDEWNQNNSSFHLGHLDDHDMVTDSNDAESMIDGVVNEDFLMSLGDNEEDAPRPVSSPSYNNDGVEFFGGDDDDFDRDPIQAIEAELAPLNHLVTSGSSDDKNFQRLPDLYPQQEDTKRQQPQRHQSFHHTIRPTHSANMGLSQSCHPPTTPSMIPMRGLMHTRSATFTRIPDRILENAPSLYSEHAAAPPISPVPNEINIMEGQHPYTTSGRNSSSGLGEHHPTPAFRVTPEPTSSSISLPDAAELQAQYKRTLQRLGRSMRQTDATRAIVHRHRSGCSQLSNDSERSGNGFYQLHNNNVENNLNYSNTAAVEEARRRLYQLISQQH